MEHLTLVIPAKNEKESLPNVLSELKKYNLKIIVVLEKEDLDTINSIKEYDCKILHQVNKGYGDALVEGLRNVKTNFFCIFNADGSFNPIELKNKSLLPPQLCIGKITPKFNNIFVSFFKYLMNLNFMFRN